MSTSPEQKREHCDDLLVMSAVHGVDDAEQLELDRLIREFDLSDTDRFESTVGALDAGWHQMAGDVLPEGFSERLKTKIVDDAASYVGNPAADSVAQDSTQSPVRPNASDTSSTSSYAWTTREKLMSLVTAASLMFALASATGFFDKPEPQDGTDVVVELTIQEKLANLRNAGLADLRVADWTNPTESVASQSATGQVVWSDSRQEGYMVIDNLQVNDPSVEQYQLWIFDTERNDDFPVDGGVFDINAQGQVIVPIDSRLPITQVKMFAITIEIPGGVVKSERERLPLLASIEL